MVHASFGVKLSLHSAPLRALVRGMHAGDKELPCVCFSRGLEQILFLICLKPSRVFRCRWPLADAVLTTWNHVVLQNVLYL